MPKLTLLDGVMAAGLLSKTVRPQLSPIVILPLALAGLLVLGAFSVLTILGYEWLMETFPRKQALAYFASGLLALSAAILMAVYLAVQNRVSRLRSFKDEIEGHVRSLLGEVDSYISGQVRTNPNVSMAASALAGFIATRILKK